MATQGPVMESTGTVGWITDDDPTATNLLLVQVLQQRVFGDIIFKI